MSDKNLPRKRGIVLNFLKRKGFGFIMGEDNVKIFVHFSDIKSNDFRTLVDGEEVEYETINGPKGLQAINVTRLNPPDEEDLPPLQNSRTW